MSSSARACHGLVLAHPASCSQYLCLLPIAGFGGPGCAQCKPGTYSTGNSTSPCMSCGPGQTSQAGSPSSSYCQCPAGQGLLNDGDEVCSVCPAGTYQPGPLVLDGKAPQPVEVGLAHCRQCPLGRTSLPGTKSSDGCGEHGCHVGQVTGQYGMQEQSLHAAYT